jgi:penicillin G amidase
MTKIEILRDRAGIPHLYAETTHDAYFGLGFAMAQDRLWQMDRLRRRALGRQAEILGPDYVDSDLVHRAVGIPAIAEREVEQIDERTRDILEHFVRGINHHIESSLHDLPVEFALLDYEPEPFAVSDVIAILRGLWWSLNGRLYTLANAEAARLLPEHLRAAFLEPEAPEMRILPPNTMYPAVESVHDGRVGMSDGTGSNNWAVSGTRTSSGKAILCGDPHQPFWVPSSWYEYAIHGPEDDAAGAAPAGVPGLWWGTNGTIAWSLTNNAASTRDLYREQLHPTDRTLYRDGATWRRFDEYEVEIAVRGQPTVRHTQRATVRGPIVNRHLPPIDEEGDPPLALRWVGQEHLDDIRAAIAIGRAQDWNSFRAAVRDWSVAVFNFVYADVEGHVGYQCAGRVPLRGRVTRGYRDANEPADAWRGYIPFDGLPHAFDPPAGFVASANERVAPDDYPYPLHGAFGAGHRGQRIREVLEAQPLFDRDQAIALQNDLKSTRAERLCPPLVERLAHTTHANSALLRDALATWDYRYTLDSVAPTLFETFMDVWQTRVVAARFPSRVRAQVQSQTGAAARLIERGDLDWFSGDLQAELSAAAGDTLNTVRARFGADPAGWRWDAVHEAHWRHPLSRLDRPGLDIGPAPVDGGADTVRNTGPFGAPSGAEYRIVVDFAEPDRFLAVQNIGNSGQPDSPHYADQFSAWLAGTYHVVSLRRSDVEADLEATTILELAPAALQ